MQLTTTQQQTFDWDAIEASRSASAQQPELIRPDRQLLYPEASSHFDWPSADALHNRDTITVDRVSDNSGQTPHRFLICRGDTVDAFFSTKKIETGEVVGISHSNNQVRVRFADSKEGIWFNTGQIYPAKEPEPAPENNGVPLSEVVDKLNAQHGEGLTEADRIPEPFTLDDHKAFRERANSADITASEWKQEFERMLASKDDFISTLKSTYNARQLQNLAGNLGNFGPRQNNKQENAESAFRSLLQMFLTSDGFRYNPMSESVEDAIARQVREINDESLADYFEKRTQAKAAREKAIKDPETLSEFRDFLRVKKIHELTEDQALRYDALEADLSRERRALKTKTTVEHIDSDGVEGLELNIIEGYHSKRDCKLWIVQLSDRIERSAFNELKTKAKQLGGWYSSFVRDQAGFQFPDPETAKKFAGLLEGDADRTEELEARKARREMTASERLHDLGESLITKADETIEASNNAKQNTPRRADVQAGVRGRAFADQALGRSLHSIAEDLSNGTAKYLDGIRHKTQVETLDTVLHLAKWARIRAIRKADNENEYGYGMRVQDEEEKPYSEEDIRFAEYPYPTVHKSHLLEAIQKCSNARGAKQASVKMAKRIRGDDEDYVTFKFESDIEQLQDFLGRAKAVGHRNDMIDLSIDRFKRLRRANIHTVHELRAALREYLPHKASVRGDDPVKVAERELIGKDIPGFFPTPRAVIEDLLDHADIEVGHSILEPSCGKGDILDALKQNYPENQVTAVELNRSLADVLGAKGHQVEFEDFLLHKGTYDRIVANPPFNAPSTGSDIDHVRHMYECLAPGGRIVTIMGEHAFFASTKRAEEFRAWLETVDGVSEELPERTFTGSDAFRETGVRARVVTIDKD